ncbi:DUF2182 domain-containing protein [Noviherbaspirillum sp.]|uniref:DUF2182 domain-containing protein n=1 Tax=Noviherbaspirillum sp. TaxID=1926288 RepID=UPI002B483E70|nr:DUF2182 domain-containing protein [Noviherbaspirillum sp.]HJV81967.1 DUF2182 domain-containing protein [Noviherbaspirillum sp.]
MRLNGHDRAPLIAGLCGVAGLSWAYLIYQDWAMRHMDIVEMAMPSLEEWSVADLFLVFSMWAIMMVAMMLPSVTPVVLLFEKVNRRYRAQYRWASAMWTFLLGYLAVWTCFSLLATAGQWWLHHLSLISPGMVVSNRTLAGTLLILAGIYQWSPLKHTCLAHCRSPLDFLMMRWRPGGWGALRMGFSHGLYCTGCCWLLMALLFVVGVMNLAWIAVLSALVLAEKIIPWGIWLARVSGILLVSWGIWLVSAT